MSHLLVFATGIVVGAVGLIINEEVAAARQRSSNVATLAAAPQRAAAGLAGYSDQTCAVEDCLNLVRWDSFLCSYHEEHQP